MPEFKTLLVHERGIGETAARPLILATCSIESTDRLDLLGEWHEPLDEPTTLPARRDLWIVNAAMSRFR